VEYDTKLVSAHYLLYLLLYCCLLILAILLHLGDARPHLQVQQIQIHLTDFLSATYLDAIRIISQ
jgi:hypothetical protein